MKIKPGSFCSELSRKRFDLKGYVAWQAQARMDSAGNLPMGMQTEIWNRLNLPEIVAIQACLDELTKFKPGEPKWETLKGDQDQAFALADKQIRPKLRGRIEFNIYPVEDEFLLLINGGSISIWGREIARQVAEDASTPASLRPIRRDGTARAWAS